jgi:hypothetical protein
VSINPGFYTEDPYVPDNLIAGDHKIVTDSVLLDGDADVARGTVLGFIPDSGVGLYVVSEAAANDGSESPVAILARDVAEAEFDDGPVEVPVYLAGEFNVRSVVFGTGHTPSSAKDALAARSIYLKDSVAA